MPVPDPSLASTLRAVVETWRAEWAAKPDSLPAHLSANAKFMRAATEWVESHGEAAAAALERGKAIEEAARAFIEAEALFAQTYTAADGKVADEAVERLRTALEGTA